MQESLFANTHYEQLTEEIFAAYYDCRKNKRNTKEALFFEKHLEKNLFILIDAIYEGTYQPLPSTVFIIDKPVTREIFAANFSDRIIHHWLINKVNPLFEKHFIEHSFACRVGKGTHKGIKCVQDRLRIDLCNQPIESYILKLDIRGFFMHINKNVLVDKLKVFLNEYYKEDDLQLVLKMIEKIIWNNPTEYKIVKSPANKWNDLPKDKSLFSSPIDCGLPIGNLTSQVFANFYLHSFDVWMESMVGKGRYFRYVDDFVIIHPDKNILKGMIKKIASILNSELKLKLHPDKIYFQHSSKGLQFLGTIINNSRRLIGKRTKGNLYKAVATFNNRIESELVSKEHLDQFISAMNSYMGLLKHCHTYNLRRKIYNQLISDSWKKYVYVDTHYLKYCKRLRDTQ